MTSCFFPFPFYHPFLFAAAKSLQSCPTLREPIDGSPPGSPSLGSSRQEHWSGLPFPSPMHPSEKWKWSRSVVSDSAWNHGLQPTRLLRPWDFPGKNTGVGCHGLLHLFCLYFVIKMPTYIKYFASCPYPSVLLQKEHLHDTGGLPCRFAYISSECKWLPGGVWSPPLGLLTLVRLCSPPLSPASWQCPGVHIKPAWQQWLVSNSSLWINHLHGLNVCFRRMSWSRVQMNWLTRKIFCM